MNVAAEGRRQRSSADGAVTEARFKEQAEGRAQQKLWLKLFKPSAFCLASDNVLPRRLGRTEALPSAFCARALCALAFKPSVKFTLVFFAKAMT
ncbi:hypothetical protein GCM10008938_25080 [Deinococcus roseus]|uniref:Uncharacterized protein n=1 Tax=Deinococcus roseus TaxID=392414 RepID=A0ABQ2D071_9DEIO|nr:hypothetical protein GCM10008938_25080 [Deinococcus roseus]